MQVISPFPLAGLLTISLVRIRFAGKLVQRISFLRDSHRRLVFRRCRTQLLFKPVPMGDDEIHQRARVYERQ